MLRKGFQSSSGKTPEFKAFCQVFKKEFTKELESIGATDISFSFGHFYISGFYYMKDQCYYFSISDVRSYAPNSLWGSLLYRTAKDKKDYTGGHNRYIYIEPGMAQNMKH